MSKRRMTNEKIKLSRDEIPRNKPNSSICSSLLRVRYLQTALILLCSCVLYIVRSSMSVAVLAMTTPSNSTDVEVYDWSETIKGTILSSFFWGYTFLQIPSGILSRKYGGHPLLSASLFVSGLLCLALPVIVKYGDWMAVCAVRAVMGLAQACLLPSCHTLMGKWSPPDELTRMSSVAYTGMYISPMLAMPLCGLLSNTALGWKTIFYCTGAMSLLVAIVWVTFSANSPAQHRFIPYREKIYIEKSLQSCEKTLGKPIPWRHILRSPALYALISAHIGSNWCFMMFSIETPAYMKAVLEVDVAGSATLAALPFVAKWILSVVFGFACEYAYNHKYLSVTASRKLFNSIGSFGAAGGLLALSYLDAKQKMAAVVLITASAGLLSATSVGYFLNHIDLSPNFCGVLYSITNFVANLTGIAEPVFTAYIIGEDSDVSRWRTVFLTTAGLTVLTNVIFMVIGTAERQPWDNPASVYNSLNLDFTERELPREECSYEFDINDSSRSKQVVNADVGT